ncbi:DUF2817 domain-containing protein [Bradyrhizobium sp. CNPSo 4010]|uniref:DUF2817 domain-containing protein n=1 Tax=Bradyrhizobium agreste TaxID=2751811 RepID=A0ABS0PGE3_9BRAD|nr:DUF2817 domain-containing protein [Bradyrhizobium agreste]MBH5396264.1 DUF2817 domain-containing protein [Bradyrhizobium agreste]
MTLNCAKYLSSSLFSDSYAEARQKFMAAAPASRAYQCSANGPAGQALFTDAAYFGAADAKKLLVLVSGTHGPEGYCGSAAQLTFLESKLHETLPPSAAVLCIHALNAYGFAWDRRVTAEGCDLNRNFIDFSKTVPPNLGYEELAEHFVPIDMTKEGIQRAEAAIAAYRSVHGELRVRAARSSGQYTRPGGLFYGGAGPTEARRILEQIVAEFDVVRRDSVIIIDYHTGLGRYGYGELQCEQASGVRGYERAVSMFGPSVTSPELGTSSSVVISGSQDEFWEWALGNRHTYVALEFGTYDPKPEVLRNDHWLFMHRPQDADSELGRQIRNATKRHYYPQRLDWKEMVVWRSHQVHRQAVEALTTGN